MKAFDRDEREFLAFLELTRRRTKFVSSRDYQIDTALTTLPSLGLRIKLANKQLIDTQEERTD